MFRLMPLVSGRALFVGLLLSSILFSDCASSSELYKFKENGCYGFRNSRGKVVILPQYEDVSSDVFTQSIQVKKDGKWGTINRLGRYIIAPQYENCYTFTEDSLARVKQGGLFGFINAEGKAVVPVVYNDTWYFKDGIVRVSRGGWGNSARWGFVDRSNTVVIPFDYQDFFYSDWREGVIGAKKDGKWGFIDRNNTLVIPFEYEAVGIFSEGLALAKQNGKWGYINKNNKAVIPFRYDEPYFCDWEAPNFKNGRATVSLNGKMGCINSRDSLIIPLKYYCIYRFCDGFAYAKIDNGKNLYGNDHKITSAGYIDTAGNEYFEPYTYAETDFTTWDITKAPVGLPDNTELLKSWDSTQVHPWTIEKLLAQNLQAFVTEPATYPDMCQLTEVCIGYGLLISGGNYSGEYMYSSPLGWAAFKKETLYKIIGSEQLRGLAWQWAMPYYKKVYAGLHPFHKRAYKEIAAYMKNYMATYNESRVRQHLQRDPLRFHHYDADGHYDRYRKLAAFVDRLIIIHKVITVKEARKWVGKMADEVAGW